MDNIDIKANILSDNLFLSNVNSDTIPKSIAERVRKNRLELNLTQKALALRAGISFASLRRFENSGEISLRSLIMIAIALDATDEFLLLFTAKKYRTIDDILVQNSKKTKKRGRIN